MKIRVLYREGDGWSHGWLLGFYKWNPIVALADGSIELLDARNVRLANDDGSLLR